MAGLAGRARIENMSTATLMTSAEFLALPDRFDDRGNRIKEELIGGRIVPGPAVSGWSNSHDITKNNIGEALALHLRAHPELGLRSLIEIAFEVAPNDTFSSDVAVVRTKRLADEGLLIKGAPEIAIEVISPSDMVDNIRKKMKSCLEHGASSVWIFYDEGSVAVHTASGVRELKGDQPLEDPLLPGFSVPVSTLYFRP